MSTYSKWLTKDDLDKIYDYNPATGDLSRKTNCGRGYIGQVIESDLISVRYHKIIKSRVIWCIYYGEWPPDDIIVEHKNSIHADDKIENLRLATKTQNGYNRGGHGFNCKGVYKVGNRWASRITANGVTLHLGCFCSEESASRAYEKAARELHGEFACPR